MTVRKLARSVLWHTPFRPFIHYRYTYNFTPGQLAFFVECLNQTANVPGDIYELGCFAGQTSVFLNRHLDTIGSTKTYNCVDTFGGFLPEHLNVERNVRGKAPGDFSGFRANRIDWVAWTLAENGCTRAKVIQADVAKMTFDVPVSFVVLDVDLYEPTLAALEHLWPALSPGGVIVVDDCAPNNRFDGALQAYQEFVQAKKLPVDLTLNKLGVIRKIS